MFKTKLVAQAYCVHILAGHTLLMEHFKLNWPKKNPRRIMFNVTPVLIDCNNINLNISKTLNHIKFKLFHKTIYLNPKCFRKPMKRVTRLVTVPWSSPLRQFDDLSAKSNLMRRFLSRMQKKYSHIYAFLLFILCISIVYISEKSHS